MAGGSSRNRRFLQGAGIDLTRWWVVAAAFLLLIGAGFLVAGLRREQRLDGGSVALVGRSRGGTIGQGTPSVVPARSVPVSLRIPSIGVSVSLSKAGPECRRDRPGADKVRRAWLVQAGPRLPGQLGSAVILGHVDDKKGPAVFYKLPTLKAGDKVDVSLAERGRGPFRGPRRWRSSSRRSSRPRRSTAPTATALCNW